MDNDEVVHQFDWLSELRGLAVLSKEQHEQSLKGKNTVDLAKEEADRIIKKAHAEAAKVKPPQETAKDIPARLDPVDNARELNELWTKIGTKFESEFLARQHDNVLHYAKTLAVSVIQESLLDPTIFERHLERLVESRKAACLCVIVHPESACLVEKAKQRIDALKDARVEKDSNLRPGDLKLRYVEGDKVYKIGEQIEIRLRQVLPGGK